MIVEFTKDIRKRKCSICSRNIKKGSIIAKQEIGNFYDKSLYFYHVDCLIKKLLNSKEKLQKEMGTIPKTKIDI